MKAKKWISALLAAVTAVTAVTMLFAGSVTASADRTGYGDASGKGDTVSYSDQSGTITITGLSDYAMSKIVEAVSTAATAIPILTFSDKDGNNIFDFGAFITMGQFSFYQDYGTMGFAGGECFIYLNNSGKKAFEDVRKNIAYYSFFIAYTDTTYTSTDQLWLLYDVTNQPCSFTGSSSSNNSSSKFISSLSATVKNQTYTGKARTPDVTLKDGSKTLKKDTDYTLTYKNNKKIGTASVTIKGKGDYSGEKTLTFKIVPKKTTLTAKKSGEKITLSWKKAGGAEKYVIYYREKGESKYKKLTTVSGSKTSYSTSKLDKNMTYQFKIRSYAESGGKKYYSSYSKVVTTK